MNRLDLIIDALESAYEDKAGWCDKVNEALYAARKLQALKPVAWVTTEQFASTANNVTRLTLHQDKNGIPLYALDLEEQLAKPEQEPVALQSIEQYRMQMAAICTAAIGYWKESDSIHPDYDSLALRDVAKLYAKYAELYTTPPRKEWVGLTDDEIDWILDLAYANDMELIKTIETKLKDKNDTF
jgi:hypothetical protein